DGMPRLLTFRQRPETIADPFLLHTVRMAIREQFRGKDKWDVPAAHIASVADVALGLSEVGAGNFLVEHLGELRDSQRRRAAEFVRHAARYADAAHLQTLTSAIQADGDKDAKGTDALVLALVRGYQERGQALPAATTEWAVGRIDR